VEVIEMSINQIRIAGTGLLFLFSFLSGFWLSKSGKPYSGIVLTIHKLISLAAVAFLAITLYRVNQVAKLNTIELTAGVVTGSFFLDAIVSGGLLSTDKPMPVVILRMHQITPLLTVLSTAVTLYLLQRP
jgi:hypothetical protein